MNIAILQDYLRCGGTEKQALFLAGYFQSQGHQVTFVTLRPGGVLASELLDKKLEHISLQKFDTKIDVFAPRLIRTLETLSLDVVLCMGVVANAYAARMHRLLPKTLVVGTVRIGRKLPYFNRRSFKQISSIVTNAPYWKEYLASCGIEKNNVSVISNSFLRKWDTVNTATRQIARNKLGVDEGTCVFLNVAAFRKGKGQDEIIHACAQLDRSKKWQVWFVGEGKYREKCEQLVQEYDLRNRVTFFGLAQNPEIYYQAADIAVLLSQEDSQPNFLVEAQWMGLPVVAYDYLGVKTCFVDQETGFLVEHGDRKQACQYMDDLLNSPPRRNQMSAASVTWAKGQFDESVQAEKYLKLFQSLRR